MIPSRILFTKTNILKVNVRKQSKKNYIWVYANSERVEKTPIEFQICGEK